MASLYILLLAFVSLCLCQTEIISLYRDNDATRAVNQYTSLSSDETTALRFALIDEHCTIEFIIGATSSELSVYEVAGRAEEDYLWKKIPSSKTSVDGITTLKFEKPACGFIFKVELASSDSDRKIEEVTMVSSAVETLSYRKRGEEQSTGSPCEVPGNVDQCMTDPFGSFCLTTNVCGCQIDADCFTATNRPYCDTAARSCVKCKFFNPATNSETTIAGVTPSQYFCRARFPSTYLLGESTPVPASNAIQTSVFNVGYPAAQESVAAFIDVTSTSNFNAAGGNYREVCDTASTDSADGSCKPCFNAEVATLQASYPAQFQAYRTAYTGTFGVPGGAMGTFHCSTIRPTDLPICSDQYYWKAAGLETLFSSGSVNLRGINLNNYKYGGGEGVSSPLNFRGACLPCRVTDTNGATESKHSLCSLALSTTPICNAQGTCSKCASNTDCAQSTTCQTTGTCKAYTGVTPNTWPTLNCQADGSCRRCTSNNDCGTLDGGETSGQTLCNTASGLCETPFSCTTNTECLNNNAALPNCNVGGTCIRCTQNSDCGATDGGEITGQSECNVATGTCVTPFSCSTNTQCVNRNAALPNCNVGGTCIRCTQNSDCGATDGGEVTGQQVCNVATGQCVLCASNGDCGGGRNCQLDGSCLACNANSCGPGRDGPPGNANSIQTACDSATGICVEPFSCTRNQDCATEYGPVTTPNAPQNCQVGGACESCIVTKTSTTCGPAKDGGETVSQPNCNQASRLCVNACTNDAQCAGTQGANCMANGVCFDCVTDADCGTSNAWGGDITGATLCDPASKLCFDACKSNGECPAGTNCMSGGRCVACVTDADCVNDGPPPKGTNTKCTGGVCVDPYLCNPDSLDNANCKIQTGQNNCMADRSCLTCRTNRDCGVNDGGRFPNQPRCNRNTGICEACQVNADCPIDAPNCGADGTCYYCDDNSCGAVDGGEYVLQPNCNPTTGICVDHCTKDEHCGDECMPRCNLERGCCVECIQNSHCPLRGWKGSALTHTQCSTDFVCVEPQPVDPNVVCEFDTDCTGSLRACSVTTQKCVECTSNVHCSAGRPVCDVASQNCVACLSDYECPKVCDINTRSCVSCKSDGDCTSSDNPACDEAIHECVECTSDSHCGGLSCDVSSRTCVECVSKKDCAIGNCDVGTHQCVECLTNADCAGTITPSCDVGTRHCVQCSHDGDCASGAPACDSTAQLCVQCTKDSHCNTTSQPACDFPSRSCKKCVTSEHCASGHYCGPDFNCYEDAITSASALPVGMLLLGSFFIFL